jgi:DNA invertase Pin-like site-specific DNA recombinase
MNNEMINENTNNDKIIKCLGYDRVSTTEQRDDGLSLDVQKTKILEKVQELGGELAEDIYTDGGISGTSMNRPGLQEMLARCSQGDITHLIVQDSSRIARNTYE